VKHIELHLHPFLGNNVLPDVVEAMNKNNLDVVAMGALDHSIFSFVLEETKKNYSNLIIDDAGIKLSDGKFFLNAREYNTAENLHVLTVGYSMNDAAPNTSIKKIIDSALENNALVLLDHPFVDNGKTRTAGHISDSLTYEVENLCKEYSGQISLEWNGYCIPWMREGLKHILNFSGVKTDYHDVNKKAEELSKKLKSQGYNVPVLADTDLHARSKKHLDYMGTSKIITDLDSETPKQLISDFKKNVFEGKYENVKKYVSSAHLLETFCVPVLFPKYFEKPRA